MIVICVLVAMLFATKLALGLYFTRRLHHHFLARQGTEQNGTAAPPATIIVCLRGADPGLCESLTALMRQDYPDYEVRIIVDHEDDPAWKIAHDAVAAARFLRARIEVLQDKFPTCSLKCSALVQAVSSLDETREVIALADADVRADSQWLRQLVAPFADPQVGLTFGNRWFHPTNARLGSMVRYLWNAAAVLYISRLGIPWGGAMALRRRVIDEAGIIAKWKQSMVDDTSISKPLAELGYLAEFVPQLVMVNGEDCSLGYCLRFLTRQLAWVRLYHAGWRKIRKHAVISSVMYLSAISLALVGIVQGRPGLLAFASACYLSRMVGMALNFRNIERGIRAHLPAAADTALRSWQHSVMIALATPIADVMHLLAVVLASTKRRFVWRGVRYCIHGPTQVRRLNYQPYSVGASRLARSNQSL